MSSASPKIDLRPVIVAFLALCVYAVYIFTALPFPTVAEVEEKIRSILTNPDLCSESNPETANAIKSIGINRQAFTLVEKDNAMPKRIDHYVKNAEGKTIAELVYYVDGGCPNLFVYPFPAKPM